jgi:heme exporter protein C
MALWDAIEDKAMAARAAAILALVGFVNIPIIKFSVNWWNTLHQPASIMRAGGPTIDKSMLIPLLTMFVAYNAYYVVVLIWRMKAEIDDRKIRVLQQNAAGGEFGPEGDA